MSNVFSSIVRLGSDPILKYTTAGKPVLSFTAASTIGFGEKQAVLWLRCAVWNNPEKIKDYLAKGGQCFVSGQLSQTEFTGNDGVKKTSLELNVSVLDFVGKKDSQSQSVPAQNQPQNSSRPPINSTATRAKDNFDDDIPF